MILTKLSAKGSLMLSVNEVPAVGSLSAKIMIIGDAPGDNEVKTGIAFSGMGGRLLDGVLDEVGLTREEIYITYVMKVRPAGNNFKNFYDKKKLSAELVVGRARLQEEIARVGPNVIVPMGPEAMLTLGLTGSILDCRGSVLNTPMGKVIPSLHPAFVYSKWEYRSAMISDFKRIIEESAAPEYSPDKRNLVVVRQLKEALHEIEKFKKAEIVTFDIEVETEQITCISFASESRRAVCFPFWFGASGSLWMEQDEIELWSAIRGLLESEKVKKVAHNGAYDLTVLRRTMGINVRNYWFDTMLGFHTLYAEFPKALAFLVSIYTQHPYYKHQLRTDSMDEYFEYNATDACLTYECMDGILSELRDAGLDNFYREYVHRLIIPLMDMEFRGVRFDTDMVRSMVRVYEAEVGALTKTLTEQVGHELNIASHKQMTEWVYKELKLPAIKKRRKGSGTATLTADEDALVKLYSTHGIEALKTVLAIRERNKILSTYLRVKLDKDKRIRCHYKISGTETGRLSSCATDNGTGTNLQNIPAGDVKRLFLADEGKVLINADLSQAEARVVAYLSQDPNFIRVFEQGGDIHKKNAANIFKVKESEVSDEQRQLAKRVVHASNYGMGPGTFSKTADISMVQAKVLLNQYFATYPGIHTWQMGIRAQLMSRRFLITPLGRKRVFFNRWGETVFKEGLAFIPQSTVADLVNQALIDLHNDGVELLLQVHDSIVVQCMESDLDSTAAKLVKHLTRPIKIHKCTLTIPVDVKVGHNWEDMKTYRQKGE